MIWTKQYEVETKKGVLGQFKGLNLEDHGWLRNFVIRVAMQFLVKSKDGYTLFLQIKGRVNNIPKV